MLGLTPHSPRDEVSAVSAAWQVVEEWNHGTDDDGIPFRDKIYAVFPGFEPSFANGKSGLHLILLFDPEIGRDQYLKTFDVLMGGRQPWHAGQLQMSNLNADVAFRTLHELHKDKGSAGSWDFIVLAPHIDSDKGLLRAQQAQVLQKFPHSEIAGLELPDDQLPADVEQSRRWLAPAMAEHRQAFFHGGDAYSTQDIGRRFTWMKLASPKIEGLRQAFIASDSRMRIAYQRTKRGTLEEKEAPDVTVNLRPWLKSVVVRGSASFFGRPSDATPTRFDLSPDMTCIIGGSMTGKSTLLDGLRVYTAAPLPKDQDIRSQVEARGRDRFLGGSAEVQLELPGADPTAAHRDQWPAVFYAQRELQRLAEEPEAVEDVLARLVAAETKDIEVRHHGLAALDRQLARKASELMKSDDNLAEAEQALDRSRRAALEIEAFADAGIDSLRQASQALRHWEDAAKSGADIATDLSRLLLAADSAEDAPTYVLPEVRDRLEEAQSRWREFRQFMGAATKALRTANDEANRVLDALVAHEQALRINLDRKLAKRGVDGAKIKEFRALSERASLLASYESNLAQTRREHAEGERAFEETLAYRRALVAQQRQAFDRVLARIRDDFGRRILARRVEGANVRPLARFLHGLKQKGVTRWWNDLSNGKQPDPPELLQALQDNTLESVGMSPAVQASFQEAMSKAKQRELAAVRCPDRYLLELVLDQGRRPLEALSGGQQVSVLLSLLMETTDDRPLVIDQPEDELDKRFLFDTLLPALKRLKGRRQVILATHDANIVVNGDADLVIQLDATASRGQVAEIGAIEDESVRHAIVQTVDGGDEAFRLRRLKYGF